MRRHRPFLLLLLGLIGCGSGIEPAVALHPLDATPGCFEALPSERISLVQSAAHQLSRLEVQLLIGRADLLTEVVRQDPTGSSWDAAKEVEGGRLHFDGRATERGPDSGELELEVTFEPDDDSSSFTDRAMVRYSPQSTVYDFGAETLEQGSHHVMAGAVARGCDPTTELSFEIAPEISEGERGILFRSKCWSSARPDPASVSPDQCAEVIERTLPRQR